MKLTNGLLLVGCAVVALAGGAAAAFHEMVVETRAPEAVADSAGASTATGVPIGGPFSLTRADGQRVTDQSFSGKWMLVYFGYTFCPDVCPTTLSHIADALGKLGSNANLLTPLFITIDPERDTPQVMGTYVRAFDPRIVGLTGTPAEIASVAKEYRVYYARDPSSDPKNYLVDHSSFIYLMTPKGAFAKVMPGSMSGQELADAIRPIITPGS